MVDNIGGFNILKQFKIINYKIKTIHMSHVQNQTTSEFDFGNAVLGNFIMKSNIER